VPPDNCEALAVGLSQMLLNQNLRVQVAIRARQYAEDNFTLKRMQARYEQLYSDLLQEKGRPP